MNQMNFIQIDSQMNLPEDTVSHMQWINQSQLAVSSWDGKLRIYECSNQNCFQQILVKNFDEPITTFAFSEKRNAFIVALLSKNIILVEQNQVNKIYQTKSFVSQIILFEQNGCMILFGEKFAYIFYQNQWFTYKFDHDVTHTDVLNDRLISCFANKLISEYRISDLMDNVNIKYTRNRLETFFSKVGYYERQQYIVCGWDGRVSVNAETIEDCYIFKAHFQKQDNKTIFYQINDLCINQYKSKTFVATCGSDGLYKIWDIFSKDRYSEFDLRAPVTNLCYNPYLQIMAVAIGYDWSHGIWGFKNQQQKPNIIMHLLDDSCFILQKNNQMGNNFNYRKNYDRFF